MSTRSSLNRKGALHSQYLIGWVLPAAPVLQDGTAVTNANDSRRW